MAGLKRPPMTSKEIVDYIKNEVKDSVSKLFVGKPLQGQTKEMIKDQIFENFNQFWKDGLIEELPEEPKFKTAFDEEEKTFVITPENETAETIIKLFNLQRSQL